METTKINVKSDAKTEFRKKLFVTVKGLYVLPIINHFNCCCFFITAVQLLHISKTLTALLFANEAELKRLFPTLFNCLITYNRITAKLADKLHEISANSSAALSGSSNDDNAANSSKSSVNSSAMQDTTLSGSSNDNNAEIITIINEAIDFVEEAFANAPQITGDGYSWVRLLNCFYYPVIFKYVDYNFERFETILTEIGVEAGQITNPASIGYNKILTNEEITNLLPFTAEYAKRYLDVRKDLTLSPNLDIRLFAIESYLGTNHGHVFIGVIDDEDAEISATNTAATTNSSAATANSSAINTANTTSNAINTNNRQTIYCIDTDVIEPLDFHIRNFKNIDKLRLASLNKPLIALLQKYFGDGEFSQFSISWKIPNALYNSSDISMHGGNAVMRGGNMLQTNGKCLYKMHGSNAVMRGSNAMQETTFPVNNALHKPNVTAVMHDSNNYNNVLQQHNNVAVMLIVIIVMLAVTLIVCICVYALSQNFQLFLANRFYKNFPLFPVKLQHYNLRYKLLH